MKGNSIFAASCESLKSKSKVKTKTKECDAVWETDLEKQNYEIRILGQLGNFE